MNDKVKQAIDKTMAANKPVVKSVLRRGAVQFDGIGVSTVVELAERQHYGANTMLDSALSSMDTVATETIKNAIVRAGRRR